MNKKVILITGASSGIGKATAHTLLKEGHTVYCSARTVEKMQDLKKHGGKLLAMDVTQHQTLERGVRTILKREGRIDVLINNAGFGLYGTVEETSIDDARYQFEVNLFGLARLTQLLLPHMRKQKNGTIVNISSVAGKIYTPLGAWYHASKHAVEGWSDCLRLEVKPFGINVVLIEPGLINTAFGDVLMQPMLIRSGKGPYKKLARRVAHATHESYKKGNGSQPSVIADTISRALRARHPKTRYAAGKLAKPILFLRRWLPDRWFDRAIMARVK